MPPRLLEHADFSRAVAEAIASLRPGEVVSYGWVAAEAGFPGRARAVGAFLASVPDDGLPWWRVVRADGRVVSPNRDEQIGLLRAEGVVVEDGAVGHGARAR